MWPRNFFHGGYWAPNYWPQAGTQEGFPPLLRHMVSPAPFPTHGRAHILHSPFSNLILLIRTTSSGLAVWGMFQTHPEFGDLRVTETAEWQDEEALPPTFGDLSEQ